MREEDEEKEGDGLAPEEKKRNGAALARLQGRGDRLEREWADWCARAVALDKATWQLWADYDAMLREVSEIQRAFLGVFGEIRFCIGRIPERLHLVRGGEGAIKWRPRP